MARIDIKGISRLVDGLKAAAVEFSDADRKTRMRMAAASKSLRVFEANEAFDRMLRAAIGLVSALATADDGKSTNAVALDDARRSFRMEGVHYAAAINELKKTPYANVFARAEREASK